ncbi:MAG: hypothetical protein H0V35_08050 [Nitrospira sp.]|nr:hypothetical protein [Nitrospira sp.]
MKHRLLSLLLGATLVLTGCVHRIHVVPPVSETTTAPLPFNAQLELPFLAIEGADHMPGIPLLEWPVKQLRQTTVDYFTQRQTFTAIGTEPADMRLVIKAWLTLRAPDRYLYRVHLESDLSFSGQAPLKAYAAEGEALGSSVRWVTASDQEPIGEATAQALRSLAVQIEQDRDLVIKNNPQKEPGVASR